ncbi:MAG: alpha/beta fold hydrolase [Deltaproteobacteria bacterium]|nr:alpha/beta fold hydrolase [Deltaproteobacteria bacterium]
MRLLCLVTLLLAACGDDSGMDDMGPAPVDMPVVDMPAGPPSRLGPEGRQARVHLPTDYDASGSYPLVIVLHGSGTSGVIEAAYFGIPGLARETGFIALAAEGFTDAERQQQWNATDACCDYDDTGSDDVGYLTDLIDEATEALAVDPARVYLLGHSTGGFMAYRMACDAPETITAIATLNGATWNDPANCGAPSEPTSVLQFHGTDDTAVLYEGGEIRGNPYPGARESVTRFAERAGCTGMETIEPFDLDSTLDGAETIREQWTDCAAGRDYALWTIEGGAHTPTFTDGAIPAVLEWLFAHSE